MGMYDGECAKCGIVEIYKRMGDPWPKACPKCKGKTFDRVFNTSVRFHGSPDETWHTENNGLGRYLPQAGPRFLDAKTKTQPNPDAYARSRSDAIEKFKKRGYPEITPD